MGIKISNIYPSFINTKMLSSLDKDYIKVIKNNELPPIETDIPEMIPLRKGR